MSKPRVLVIGGGPSDEREISSLSSKAVFDALKSQAYSVEYYDWDGSIDWLQDNLARFDVVLPILHGAGGEDGVIQKILEDASIPYLGSNSEVSKLCFDKKASRIRITELGIVVPDGAVVTMSEYQTHPLYSQPHVLKPYNGGSSIDTYILANPSDRPNKLVEASFSKHHTMLLEQFIKGIEITVPVLGGVCLPTIEIHPPKSGTFDYANKYNGATTELCPAQSLTKDQQKTVNDIALRIYTAFGCRHLARIDMIVTKDTVYVLEVNTLPGMTEKSLFPKASAAIGMDFNTLAVKLLELSQKGDG
ncbi:D-alanine--D-alanine ligase [Candidatus Saccharibacteria bacterium]|nr:D-alanine--D-alanine ligase [Candidatus Saccharibacteria bacterium]